VRAIRLLHGRPPSDFDLGPDLPQGEYATTESFECITHTPNLIVNIGRTVKRYNDIVHRLRNRRSLSFQQQTGSEQREPHAFRSEEAAERRQIGVHLRFSPGKDNPPDPEFSQGLNVNTKVVGCNLPDLTDAPDITHHATAVAAIVGE